MKQLTKLDQYEYRIGYSNIMKENKVIDTAVIQIKLKNTVDPTVADIAGSLTHNGNLVYLNDHYYNVIEPLVIRETDTETYLELTTEEA